MGEYLVRGEKYESGFLPRVEFYFYCLLLWDI